MIGDVLIQSSLAPDVSFNALEVSKGQEHSGILQFLKPKIIIDLGSGPPLVYAPYGEPIPYGWLYLVIGLALIFVFLRK